MTLDIETTTAISIWNLFVGSQEWRNVFDQANRLNAIEIQGTQKGIKMATADGDYPECYLRCLGGNSTPFGEGQNFETHSPEGPSHWPEKSTIAIRVVVTAMLASQGEVNYASSVVRNVLRKAGPKLGLSWVEDYRLSWENGRTASAPTDESDADHGTIRERSVFTLTISTYHDGAELAALLNQ